MGVLLVKEITQFDSQIWEFSNKISYNSQYDKKNLFNLFVLYVS